MTTAQKTHKSIKKLISNLEAQLEIHEVLFETLNHENQLPASCSLSELLEVHTNRDFAAKRIHELECERIKIIQFYKTEAGLENEVTLKSIIESATGQTRKRLLDLRQGLLELLLQIKPVGKRNAEQAVARVTCFNEIQGAIHKSFKRLFVYSGNGLISTPKGACMVRKAI